MVTKPYWREVYENLPECDDLHCKVKAVALFPSGEEVDGKEVIVHLCARHFIKYVNGKDIKP